MKKLYFAVLLMLFFATTAFAELNINTASKDELNGLPGIGPVKAEAIIKYRDEKGPFKNIEDLKNVYGIGDKIFNRLKSEISVANPEAAPEQDKAVKDSVSATKSETKEQAAAESEKKTVKPASSAETKTEKKP